MCEYIKFIVFPIFIHGLDVIVVLSIFLESFRTLEVSSFHLVSLQLSYHI